MRIYFVLRLNLAVLMSLSETAMQRDARHLMGRERAGGEAERGGEDRGLALIKTGKTFPEDKLCGVTTIEKG